jgi:hypothetical protein
VGTKDITASEGEAIKLKNQNSSSAILHYNHRNYQRRRSGPKSGGGGHLASAEGGRCFSVVRGHAPGEKFEIKVSEMPFPAL